MLAMIIGIAGFVILINTVTFSIMDSRVDEKLELVYTEFDAAAQNSVSYDMHFFAVKVREGNEIYVIPGSIKEDMVSRGIAYAAMLEDERDDSDYIDEYKYKRFDMGDGEKLYFFLDCTRELKDFNTFVFLSVGTSFAGILVVYLLIRIFSNIALRPAAQSYERQKSFVTDAGHELKTPLAIIAANADILELENGESEWIDSIRVQTERMKKLTERLVYLSKMQEGASVLKKTELNFSDLVYEAAEPYLAPAMANNRTLNININEDSYINGNEDAICQLVSILLDNAIKYSNDGGIIGVNISTDGKRVMLTVFNTVDKIEPGEHNRFFDRFYRADESRNSKTGGSGIGLSVAKEIVASHGGSISAYSRDDKSIELTAVFVRAKDRAGDIL